MANPFDQFDGIAELEQQNGLPSGILSAVMQAESGGNPNAISPKGALGPFQLMPATAQQLGVDPTNPQQAAAGAAKYLSTLLQQNKGDVKAALAAYNWGPGNVAKFGIAKAPPETQAYIAKVTGMMQPAANPFDQFDGAAAPPDSSALSPQQADAALPPTLPIFGMDTGIPIPKPAMAAIVGAGNTAEGWINGARQMLPGSNAALSSQAADERQRMGALQQAHPVATLVGEIAPYFATSNPLALAAMSGAQYGTPTQRATNAALAFGGAKVAQGVARMFGPQSMAPVADNGLSDFIDNPATNPWGIPTRMAQNTDSKSLKLLDSVLGNVPGVGAPINKAINKSFTGFRQAVGNTFGADTPTLSPSVIGQYQSGIGTTIGNLAARNTLQASTPFNAALDAVQARINNELVGEHAALAQKWLDNVQGAIQPSIDASTGTVNGVIPGAIYKDLDSQIGQAAKGPNGSANNVLGDLRGALRDAMDASITPEDSQAWQTARRQYFNVKQVGNAMAATPGELSPTRLLSTVNQAQKNARFGAGNDLAQIAQWAKMTLPDTIPNSGTPQRLLMQSIVRHPIEALTGAGALGYGYHESGLSPIDPILGGLLGYAAARGIAGVPVSAATRALLTSAGAGVGGLLGQNLAQ